MRADDLPNEQKVSVHVRVDAILVQVWDVVQRTRVTSFDAHTQGYFEAEQLWLIGSIDWAVSGLIATSGTGPATLYDRNQRRFLGPAD